MTHTIPAILLASLIATEDPHADSWDAVQWAREAMAMATDLQIPHATDRDGFPIVDSLPPESLDDAFMWHFYDHTDADRAATLTATSRMREHDTYTGWLSPASCPVDASWTLASEEVSQ